MSILQNGYPSLQLSRLFLLLFVRCDLFYNTVTQRRVVVYNISYGTRTVTFFIWLEHGSDGQFKTLYCYPDPDPSIC